MGGQCRDYTSKDLLKDWSNLNENNGGEEEGDFWKRQTNTPVVNICE